MRIALLTPELSSLYGWARYALELTNALSAQGVEVVVLAQRGKTLPPEPVTLADFRPVLPQLFPPIRWFLPRSLASLMSVRHAIADCDLVHPVAEPYTLASVLTAGKRPVVTTAHGTYVPQNVRRRLSGKLYRHIYRRAHLVAVSQYTAAQVQGALPGVDTTVIHNGVHFARFQEPVPPPEKRGPTVFASGGVKMRKGTHLLVAAMAIVREHIPDVQLVITGLQTDPDYLAMIGRRIEEAGLQDCIHLAGLVDEQTLVSWYQNADVFALPSLSVGGKFEGFGLVFLEASAAGLPVIGTTGSGIEEAIIDGETGLLIPQDNATILADAILRLLTNPALRAQMSTAGRNYAQTQDWSVVATRMIALYQQLLT
jgi:phosphatidyl-myo-inositol dimannoside synthase